MSGAEQRLPRQRDDADVAQVVDVLHRAGPLDLEELAAEPALADWTAERLENAIVCAWSHTMIFVDRRDHLVALGTPARG